MRRRRKSKTPAWLLALVDRAALAVVMASLTGISGCLAGYRQQSENVSKLRQDVKDLEWGVDYYRQ